MKNFRQYFVLKFFHEEKFKMQKIFVKSLSDENFSMTKKRRFTVHTFTTVIILYESMSINGLTLELHFSPFYSANRRD